MKTLSKILCHPVADWMKFEIKDAIMYIPWYGSISCGLPGFVDNELKGYLEIPENLIGPGEFFVLRAKGDSMVDAGIDDGDLVIVKKQSYAEESQIVVAYVDGETTLKRFYRNDDQKYIELRPENKKYKSIFVSTCLVFGVAIKIIKDL